MKLELKHLAGYLPYGTQGLDLQSKIVTLSGIKKQTYFIKESSNNYAYGDITDFRPIVRPLSDLTKEMEVNGEKFVPIEKLAEIDEVVVLQYSVEFFETSMKYLPNWIVQKFLEWHFDIYGLIENGLAIDINTLKL